LLADHEESEAMKTFDLQIRDFICLFFFEDFPYGGRLQWIAEHLDITKLFFSKDERYWFKLNNPKLKEENWQRREPLLFSQTYPERPRPDRI
jgi:hypothetical protein